MTEDKIQNLMTLEIEKEKEYWETWQKLFSNMFGG